MFHTISNWVTQRSDCSYAFRLVQALFTSMLKFMRSADLFVCFLLCLCVCWIFLLYFAFLHTHMCSISKLARRNFLWTHTFSSVQFVFFLLGQIIQLHIDFLHAFFVVRFFQFTIGTDFCTFWLLWFDSFSFFSLWEFSFTHFKRGYRVIQSILLLYWIIIIIYVIPMNDSAEFSPPSHLIATA